MSETEDVSFYIVHDKLDEQGKAQLRTVTHFNKSLLLLQAL